MNVSSKEPVAVVGTGRTRHVVPRKAVCSSRASSVRGLTGAARGLTGAALCDAVDFVRSLTGKDCTADLYRQARITDPSRQIDAVETYVPFSWDEPMWLKILGFAAEGDSWRLTEAGATELDGGLPVDMSGGVLSTNSIGSSGLIGFAEAPLQRPGPGASTRSTGPATYSATHTGGRGSRLFPMWVAGAEPPTD